MPLTPPRPAPPPAPAAPAHSPPQVVDNLERGVLEPAMSKVKSLRFATEAAVTIMRIDDRITIRAAEQGQGGGHMH